MTTTSTTITAEQVPASELAVGDLIGTTRANSRKAIAGGEGQRIARITNGSGRVQARGEDGKIIRSCDPETKVWRGRIQEDSMTEQTEQTKQAPAAQENGKAKPAAFEWPTDPAELLNDYLAEQVSAERNAPNEGKPFITSGGILRIRGEHWINWLNARGIAAPKLEASRPIRELGFAMKPYPLPGEDRSHGFYTGPAPKGTEKLPRRELERAAAAPRNPFAKLSGDQIGVLKSALANFRGNAAAKATRDELAEMVQRASDAQLAAAEAADAEQK